MTNVLSSDSADTGTLTPAAIEAWRRRIRAETFGNYSVIMGVRLLCLKEPSAAINHLRQADGHLGGSAEARYLLVQALIAGGHADEAERLKRDTAAAQPDYERRGLAAALDRLAEARAYADAITLIQTAPAHLQNDAGIQSRLADYQARLNQP